MSASHANSCGKNTSVHVVYSLLTFLAVCCGSSPAPAEEPAQKQYPIRLFCPNKLTDKLELSTAVTQESEDSYAQADDANAKPGVHQFTKSPSQNIDVQLEATLQPVVLDSKGQVVKYSVRIKKFVRRHGKGEFELLPAGSVFIADNTGKAPDAKTDETQYMLENGKLEPTTIESLQFACFAVKPEAATDDEAFGTDARQKIGGKWAMNPAKAGKNSVLDGWSTAPEHAKGTVTLDGVETIEGKQWIKVRIEATSDKSEPTSPGETVEKASFRTTYVLSTPLILSVEGSYRTDSTSEIITKYANNGGYNRSIMKFHYEARYTLPAPTK